MADLTGASTTSAPSAVSGSGSTAGGGQSGFDLNSLLSLLTSGAGAATAYNAAGQNDSLVKSLLTKVPNISSTVNGGTSTLGQNGALTLDNGSNTSLQDLFKTNAAGSLNNANGLNPAVLGAAQGVTDATGKSYNDVYGDTLSAIRGQLQDTQQKTWNNLASNLFSTGNLGSSGGALQTEAFMKAAGQNDLQAQLAAQQSALGARSSDINAATTNFNVQNAAQQAQTAQSLQDLSGSNAIDQNTLAALQTAIQGSVAGANANNQAAGTAYKSPTTTADSLLASLLSRASGGSSGTGALGGLANGVDSLFGGSGNASNDATNWLKNLFGGSSGSSAPSTNNSGIGSGSVNTGLPGSTTTGTDANGATYTGTQGTDTVGSQVSNPSSGGSGSGSLGSLAGDAGTAYSGYNGVSNLFNGATDGIDQAALDKIIATDGTPASSSGAGAGGALGGSAGSGTAGMSGASAALLAGAGYTAANIIGDITNSKPGAQLNFSNIKPDSGVDITMQIPGVNANLVGSPTAGVAYGLGSNPKGGSGYWYYKDPKSSTGWSIDSKGVLAGAADLAPKALSAILGKPDSSGGWTFNGPILGQSAAPGQGPGYNFGGQQVVSANDSNTVTKISPDGTMTQTSGYGPYKTTTTSTALSDAYQNFGGKASGLSFPDWVKQLANINGAKSGYVNGTPG